MKRTTIPALDFLILKIMSWGVEDEKWSSIAEGLAKYKVESLLLLPYIITTANGTANRNLLMDNTFETFCFETDLGYVLKDMATNYPKESIILTQFEDDTLRFKSTSITADSEILSFVQTAYSLSEQDEDWKNTLKGLNHSINIFRDKHKIALYELNKENMAYNIGLSSSFKELNEYVKTPDGEKALLLAQGIVSRSVIINEASVYAEFAENAIAM